MKKVIDCRVRPYYGGWATSWLYYDPLMASMASHFNLSTAAGVKSMEGILDEMEQAGVVKAVAPCRPSTKVKNSELVGLMDEYPDKFITMFGIDPFLEDAEYGLEALETYVVNGPCQGVAIECSVFGDKGNICLDVNDPMMFKYYERMNELELPVFFTWGGKTSPSLEHGRAKHIEDIIKRFPKMKVALCHGGFPYVEEYCWLAFQHKNLWLSPDMYVINTPGGSEYIAAMNGLIKERMLFGSTFPILHITDTVKFYQEHLTEQAQELVMYKNALEFLGLTEDQI